MNKTPVSSSELISASRQVTVANLPSGVRQTVLAQFKVVYADDPKFPGLTRVSRVTFDDAGEPQTPRTVPYGKKAMICSTLSGEVFPAVHDKDQQIWRIYYPTMRTTVFAVNKIQHPEEYARLTKMFVKTNFYAITVSRAEEIFEECKKSVGPWSDNLRHILTAEEIFIIKALWDSDYFPGSSSFVSVFLAIKNGEF